ncbi:ABC transporter substrate-binding protein [Anaerosporobacter sp.]|uniref:ABC transporter substrate-binding protein n=1 Tax=Anaerosporobacter sp. TaxID=1872529 RepID=UPI00286EBF51|nr:ABC transporter substrate-binding protein [Anaerosporobacter sp.]
MKRKKVKQVLALLLCLSISLGMLAGCGSSNKKENNTSTTKNEGTTKEDGTTDDSKTTELEHVDLTMYLLGDRTPDFDEVYAKVNEILERKLNCTLKVEFLSWGEHGQKYPLLFSADEDFDLIFTATSWGHYEQTVTLGGFKPLSEEFIQTYAPDIWNAVPAEAWDQAKINGEIYMVPGFNREFGQDITAVRGDLMDKYGFSEITTLDQFNDFAMKLAADGMYASQGGFYYQYFWSKGMNVTGGTPKSGEMILYNSQDPEDLNFYYILDWDGYTDYCKKAKEMADAGCWSQDAIYENEDRQTGLLTGKNASMLWNLATTTLYAKQANRENPTWDVRLCDLFAGMPRIVKPYINSGISINANSKKAERAMMVLNAFYTDKEIYDLTYLGIEGKHWEAVGDDQYKEIDESGYGVDANCNWGWRNMNLTRTAYIENRTPLDDSYDKILEEWNSNIKPNHVYDGFNFDPTNVSTQVAAVEANVDKYYTPLFYGLVKDVDATIAEFKKALEKAGIRDILDELNRQAAEFVASKQ